jgi:hypothetical protein
MRIGVLLRRPELLLARVEIQLLSVFDRNLTFLNSLFSVVLIFYLLQSKAMTLH